MQILLGSTRLDVTHRCAVVAEVTEPSNDAMLRALVTQAPTAIYFADESLAAAGAAQLERAGFGGPVLSAAEVDSAWTRIDSTPAGWGRAARAAMGGDRVFVVAAEPGAVRSLRRTLDTIAVLLEQRTAPSLESPAAPSDGQ